MARIINMFTFKKDMELVDEMQSQFDHMFLQCRESNSLNDILSKESVKMTDMICDLKLKCSEFENNNVTMRENFSEKCITMMDMITKQDVSLRLSLKKEKELENELVVFRTRVSETCSIIESMELKNKHALKEKTHELREKDGVISDSMSEVCKLRASIEYHKNNMKVEKKNHSNNLNKLRSKNKLNNKTISALEDQLSKRSEECTELKVKVKATGDDFQKQRELNTSLEYQLENKTFELEEMQLVSSKTWKYDLEFENTMADSRSSKVKEELEMKIIAEESRLEDERQKESDEQVQRDIEEQLRLEKKILKETEQTRSHNSLGAESYDTSSCFTCGSSKQTDIECDLKNQNNTLMTSIAAIQDELNLKTLHFIQSEAQCKVLLKKEQELVNEIEFNTIDSDNKNQELENQIVSSTAKETKYKIMIKKLMIENTNYKSKMGNSVKSIEAGESKLEAMKKEFQTKLSNVSSMNSNMEKELNVLQERNYSKIEEYHKLEASYEGILKQLKEVKEGSRGDIQTLQTLNNKLQQELDQKTIELEEAQSSPSSCDSENDDEGDEDLDNSDTDSSSEDENEFEKFLKETRLEEIKLQEKFMKIEKDWSLKLESRNKKLEEDQIKFFIEQDKEEARLKEMDNIIKEERKILREEEKKLKEEFDNAKDMETEDNRTEEEEERKFEEAERLQEEIRLKEDQAIARLVLGVGSDTSLKKIGSAFRKLSLKLHPDKNKDPGARARFDELKTAYDTLTGRAKILSDQSLD